MQGLGENCKRRQIFHYLHKQKVDIALLQETHSIKNKHRIRNAEFGGKIVFSDDSSRSAGVAICFAKKLNVNFDDMEIIKEGGRLLMIQIPIEGKVFCLINVYAPNEDVPEFFNNIFQKIENVSADHIILMGDLNVWLDPKWDKKGGNQQKLSKSAESINSFLQQEDWLDVWRALNKEKFCFTWKRKCPMIMSRLDYLLAPISTAMKITHCEILPAYLSDHCPVLCELTLDSSVRGPGLWKFNTRHLENKDYVDRIAL